MEVLSFSIYPGKTALPGKLLNDRTYPERCTSTDAAAAAAAASFSRSNVRTVVRVWCVCQAWRIVAAMTSRSSLTPDDDVTATVTSSSPAAAAAAGGSSAATAAGRGAGASLLKTAPPAGPAAARQQPAAAAAAEAVNPLSIGYVTAALVLGLLCLVLGVVYGFIHFTRVNPRFRLARLVHDQGNLRASATHATNLLPDLQNNLRFYIRLS